MHISFHVVSISRGGLYAHPLCRAPSVAGGNKSRPYEKNNEDDTAVIVALCLYEDGTLEHREYLCDEDKDPREEFTSTLTDALGENGTIFIYTTY